MKRHANDQTFKPTEVGITKCQMATLSCSQQTATNDTIKCGTLKIIKALKHSRFNSYSNIFIINSNLLAEYSYCSPYKKTLLNQLLKHEN
jgi:hypothetical protein